MLEDMFLCLMLLVLKLDQLYKTTCNEQQGTPYVVCVTCLSKCIMSLAIDKQRFCSLIPKTGIRIECKTFSEAGEFLNHYATQLVSMGPVHKVTGWLLCPW